MSFPGLESTDCCINNRKNIPNALCEFAPKSPLLVHTNVISPLANILSYSKLFVLLHNIFFTPGFLNKLSNSAEALNIEVFVFAKSLPSA